jgi:hypothetical protein
MHAFSSVQPFKAELEQPATSSISSTEICYINLTMYIRILTRRLRCKGNRTIPVLLIRFLVQYRLHVKPHLCNLMEEEM